MIYWLLGQPGSGKTTVAKKFIEEHPDWMHIDGDHIREIFKNTNYGIQGRIDNHTKAIELAKFIQLSGKNIVVSMVTPYRFLRSMILENLKDVFFVYLTYSPNEERGKEKFHVVDFEYPFKEYKEDTWMLLNTSGLSVSQCVNCLNEKIK